MRFFTFFRFLFINFVERDHILRIWLKDDDPPEILKCMYAELLRNLGEMVCKK